MKMRAKPRHLGYKTSAEMDSEIAEYVAPLVGKPCCRKRIGRGRSLSIGFGGREYHHKSNLPDPFYGEWELGCYSSGWRIMQDGRIIFASNDPLDSIADFNMRLAEIPLGRFESISRCTEMDIRVRMDSGYGVDFLAGTSDDDESFHLFGPSKLYIQFTPAKGWKVGKSNKPWKN